MSMRTRVDVMVDIETLSMGNYGSLLQLSAVSFDIYTGRIETEFNMYVDVSTDENLNVSGDTLLWWFDSERIETLKTILENGNRGNSEIKVLTDFMYWLKSLKDKYENLYVWGNGILDDNRYLKAKFDSYQLGTIADYDKHRDLRTLMDTLVLTKGISPKRVYSEVNKELRANKNWYNFHNALDDAKYQVLVLKKILDLMKY